jgi:glycosyltransferase involved in cell wall biosynthesis
MITPRPGTGDHGSDSGSSERGSSERGSGGVLMVVEQLRRAVPGGSGTYAAGVISGIQKMRQKNIASPPIALLASKPRGQMDPGTGTSMDPIIGSGLPYISVGLPAPLLTRGWDSGLVRAPSRFRLIHGASMAVPRPALQTSTTTRTRTRTIVTVHDIAWRQVPFAYPPRGRKWHEHALIRSIRSGHRFVVSSDKVAGELHDAGAAVGSVSVIEPGGDHLPAPNDRIAKEVLSRLGVDGPFILTVGTLEPRKNLQALIDAYAKVRDTFPRRLPLVVVGPKGWGPEVIPVDGVVFAGMASTEELSSLYSKAEFLAYVPLLEGYGLPPLEAMQAGIPVLASPMPSLGGAALEVNPKDTANIAEGLLELATDQQLRSNLVSAGRRRAEALTWEACASKHVDLWFSVLDEIENIDETTRH